MPIYTYIGNINPNERTERLVLRDGNLIVNAYEYTDFTVAELESLNGNYRLLEGAYGKPASEGVSESGISFFDLEDTPELLANEVAAGDGLGGLTAVSVARGATVDLSIRDYTGLDYAGGSDMAASLNSIIADASAVAVDGGYPYVTLGGFRRGHFRIDSPLYFQDRVRIALDEATVFAGQDFDVADYGMFRALEVLNAARIIGVGTTNTATPRVITSVASINSWSVGDLVISTSHPARTRITHIDRQLNRLITDKSSTDTGTITLTKAATYYGNYRNCGLIGGVLDPNEFRVRENVRALWLEDFVFDGVTALHNRADTDDPTWAIMFGGRDILAKDVKVKGGRRVFEDALHMIHGQRVRILNPDVESGDDGVVVGSEMSVTLVAQADPIRSVTIANASVKSRRGFGLSVYAPEINATALSNGWTQDDYGVDGVTCVGLVGSSGDVRNGGIKLWSVGSEGDGPGEKPVRNVVVRGVVLDIGSAGHDGVNPAGVYCQGCNEIDVEARFIVRGEKTGGTLAERMKLAHLRDSRGVELKLAGRQTGTGYQVEVGKSDDITLRDSNIRHGGGTDGWPVRFFDTTDVKVIDTRLTDIPDGKQGISIETSGGITSSAEIVRTTVKKISGASVAYGVYVVSGSFSHLALESNDFHDCSAGVQSIGSITSGPSYLVKNNRGLGDLGAGVENGQPGIVAPTLTFGSEVAVLTTANQAYYSRFVPSTGLPIASMIFTLLVAATNADEFSLGIVSGDGQTLLATTGIKTTATTGGNMTSTGSKVVALLSPVTLVPGTPYYAVFTRGPVTGVSAGQIACLTVGAAAVGAMFSGAVPYGELGVQSSAHPAAAPITLANASASALLGLKI